MLSHENVQAITSSYPAINHHLKTLLHPWLAASLRARVKNIFAIHHEVKLTSLFDSGRSMCVVIYTCSARSYCCLAYPRKCVQGVTRQLKLEKFTIIKMATPETFPLYCTFLLLCFLVADFSCSPWGSAWLWLLLKILCTYILMLTIFTTHV